VAGFHHWRNPASRETSKGKHMSNSNKKPVSKVTLWPITAAIWRNENAKGEPFYNVTLERTYKDEAGELQNTTSLAQSDLLLAAKVLDRAHSEIYKLRASDRQAQQDE
jgi:hypothetical protein